MSAQEQAMADAMERLVRCETHLHYVLSYQFHTMTASMDPRYADPKCLLRHGYRVYSQNEEDGILDEIFRRIETDTRYFVEFGVGDGMENNTVYRLLRGWRGAWIDANPDQAALIEERFARHLSSDVLRFKQAFITAECVNTLFAELSVPREFDLLSIDIDGNDYWVWKALEQYRPRAVVIEYNAGFGPTAEWVLNYDPECVWEGTRNFGASLKSLELLGAQKGYKLVGCNIKGMNAFFVRDDLVRDRFLATFTAETHYEPPRYHLWFSTGHRKSVNELASFPIR